MMKLVICENIEEFSTVAANLIYENIYHRKAAICLPTGSTPIPVYEKLVSMMQDDKAFAEVKFFNLDEYAGLDPSHHQSYAYFLNQHLYDHIPIRNDQLFLLNGSHDPQDECKRYDTLIDEIGRFDIVVDGIGTNGHIAFNEPADYFTPRTYISEISASTLQANRKFFNADEIIPQLAITLGFEDIMKAKKVILLATGPSKKEVIHRFLTEKKISTQFPISLMNMHPDLTLIVDREAYTESL
jgi:glucosamine-6-phosphate deaminase